MSSWKEEEVDHVKIVLSETMCILSHLGHYNPKSAESDIGEYLLWQKYHGI